MDTSPFDTGYTHVQHPQGNGVYGSMSGFDSASLKYHHGLYPDASTDAASFYQNYMHSGLATPQDYNHRDPPSYSESTIPSSTSSLFHPGFAPSAVDYYKTGGMGGSAAGLCTGGAGTRSTDLISDYQGVVRNSAPAMTDNFLLKQEGMVGGGVSSESAVGGGHFLHYGAGRYSEEDLHHLQHQHHQQQQNTLHHLQQPPQQVQAPKPPMQQMPGELQQEECKLEPDNQHDFKSQNISMTPTAPINNLQHHQQVPEDQSDLPQPPPLDATEPHAQSPCSDVTSGEGTEMTSGSQETDVNTSSELSQTQQDGSAGSDPAKNSNEVKPTLSYIALIAKSILESPTKRLNLGSIYGWIEKNFPYYQNRGQGWRNSVRHNLSLNDCFIKAGRCEDGKGNYWAIHPANLQDFLRGDFRQRRRSRRRGRKKDCELGLYHHHQFSNGYLGAAAAGSSLGVGTQMPAFSPSAAALYSPYTEAERRAYRLDEALLRQSMNNPFFKWYHQSSAYAPTTSPSPVNTGVYSGVGSVAGVGGVSASNSQWPQTYPDNNGQAVYPLNSSFPR